MFEKKRLIIVVLVFFFAFGCAQLGFQDTGGEISFTDMTTKQQAIFIMDLYNKQFDRYQKQVLEPNLTDIDKEVLRTKYGLLKDLYQYIDIYNVFVDTGGTPDEKTEAALISLIAKLQKI